MSSTRYATPLLVEPRPSLRLLSWVLISHSVFLGLVFWAMPLSMVLLGACLCVSLSLLTIWRRHFSRPSALYVRRATWHCDDAWALECGDGRCFPARLSLSGFCHTKLILLNFDLGKWRRRTLLLTPDTLPPETLRRLRQRLRALRRP